jgi:hypothetical protein
MENGEAGDCSMMDLTFWRLVREEMYMRCLNLNLFVWAHTSCTWIMFPAVHDGSYLASLPSVTCLLIT